MDVDQFFQNSHYNISRILLSINGLWPFHTKIKRYVIYFILILIIGSGFIFQVMGIIEIRENSFEVIDALPFLLLGIVVICKMMFAIYMLPKIKLLLIKIQEYSLISKSNEEHKIHNLYAVFGRNLSYAYTYIVLGHSFLFNAATLLTRLMRIKDEKNDTSSNEMTHTQIGVAYRVNYVIDFDKYYVIIFIHTTFCIVWYVFLPVALDVLYITLIEHCRGLFAAVKYRLENALLSENDKFGSTKTSTRNKFYLNMVYSIRRHTEAIQFLNLINSAFSPPLFMHMGGMLLGLGVVEYQVITNMHNINRLLKYISFFNGLVINVFFENWLGQKIIDSSEKVFESAYNAEWYNMPLAAKKLVVLIMLRSIRPMVLTAGKFMTLSYVTFNAVMRTTSSYFMLLQSLS